MSGSTDTGEPRGDGMHGFRDGGIVLRILVRIGVIRTMIIIGRVGRCMRATGITRIMEIITTMIITSH